jgi:hypothetical protein
VRKLFVLVLVLAGLVVLGDRAAAALGADRAERELADRGLVAPVVQLRGFPFLTQLAARRFDDVSVRARSVPAGDGRADQLVARLRGVRVPSSGPVRVESLTASGTVPYAEVAQALDVPSLRLSRATGGQLRVSRDVEVLGQRFSVAARARVEAQDGRVRLVATAVEVGGRTVDEQLSRLLVDRMSISYRVPGLPRGVRLQRVTAAATGFRVHLTGQNAVLSRP